MIYINRKITPLIQNHLKRGHSILLLGPRQTGKTTLLKQLSPDLFITFAQPRIRQQYEIDPGILTDEVEELNKHINCPFIIIDEVQKVPLIMDAVQDLIDRKLGQFILTGSSARKLKHGPNINLLPGRMFPMHLDPLMLSEIPNSDLELENLLISGSLPKIITTDSLDEKEEMLTAYVTLYLEDEVRAEALVRNLASFAQFLKLAAGESGYTINAAKLSQKIGVARTTIIDYFQILEDCLIVEGIEPLTKSKTRHKLAKTKKYIFFDLGVRRLAADEGTQLPQKFIGHLFEQFIGIELIRQSRIASPSIKLNYWKDNDGPEVDWVLARHGNYIPIEVKYTNKPSVHDAKHLLTFLKEYETATTGFVVCQIPRARRLTDNITAIPWQNLHKIIEILETQES